MSKAAQQIARQQDEILHAMSRIRVMRRGTVSHQTYPQRAKRKDGNGAVGPYAIWQGSVDGAHFGKRVSGAQAQRVQEDIVQRHAFETLCEQYVTLSCQLAALADAGDAEAERVKKNATRV